MGKTIPFALIALFEMIFITILGVAIFTIPIYGPLWLLPVSTAIYLLSVLSIGILWTQMLALFIVGVVVFTMSALRFRNRLG